MILPQASSFPPVLVLTSDTSGWEAHPSNISTIAHDTLCHELHALGITVHHASVGPATIGTILSDYHPNTVIVLNWTEGWADDKFEYATQADILASRGYTFTGSPAPILRIEQHKDRARALLTAAAVPFPPYRIVTALPVNDWQIFPAIVKPAHVHCSEGISRASVVDTPTQLAHQVDRILQHFHCPVIIEQFLTGVEYHVGIWGNGDAAQVLPISAIDYAHIADYHDQLCTESAKWQFDDPMYQLLWHSTNGWHFPTTIPADIYQQLCNNAIAAYRALGLRDYGRIDMRVHDGVAYVIDINANPGIDFDGKLAIMSSHAGYTYGQFIAQILAFANERRMGE